ncbi:39036_t:CDS:1, partial [Gigaspora margarita]
KQDQGQSEQKWNQDLPKSRSMKPKHKTKRLFTKKDSTKNVERQTQLNKVKQDQEQSEQGRDQDLPKSRSTKLRHDHLPTEILRT